MQRGGKAQDGGEQRTRISDLRASVIARKPDPHLAKPPKPRKPPKRESEDERALKAEKLAQAQHTTSLLKGGKSARGYERPGEKAERVERRQGGFFFQLVLVIVAAAGIAYALDPTILPPEWAAKLEDWVGQGRAFVSQYVEI
jgi:hypothetical protein